MAKKSVTTRIRKTRTGKLLKRHMGVNHFRAKKTSKQKQGRKGSSQVHAADKKLLGKYL